MTVYNLKTNPDLQIRLWITKQPLVWKSNKLPHRCGGKFSKIAIEASRIKL